MRVDPADHAAVGEALLPYLQARLGSDVEFASPPEALGRGFDTFIYTFAIRSEQVDPQWLQPLVLRAYPSESEATKARREASIQEFVADRGYPALKPLAIETRDQRFGLPFMIMRRVEGGTVLQAITGKPWRARGLLRSMAELHVRLHQLQVAGCPLDRERPLGEVVLSNAGSIIDEFGVTHMEEGFAWLEAMKGLVLEEVPVLCHNDFHPLNILLESDGHTMAVIDWPDAGLGDRHCDVARTVAIMWFAQIAATSAIERFVLKAARGFLRGSYFNRYQELLPVDRRRLDYWETMHTFVGWAQLEAVEVRAARGDQQTEMVQRLPAGTTALARNRFWKLAQAFG
jgi:aminoglycoside phosphotransferase (APT) family kinase protein